MNIDFPEVRATFEFEGQTVGEIGLRYKGASTYMAARNSAKKSFKLDFNQFVNKQKFFIPADSIEKSLEWIAYCRFSEFDPFFQSAFFPWRRGVGGILLLTPVPVLWAQSSATALGSAALPASTCFQLSIKSRRSRAVGIFRFGGLRLDGDITAPLTMTPSVCRQG